MLPVGKSIWIWIGWIMDGYEVLATLSPFYGNETYHVAEHPLRKIAGSLDQLHGLRLALSVTRFIQTTNYWLMWNEWFLFEVTSKAQHQRRFTSMDKPVFPDCRSFPLGSSVGWLSRRFSS